LKPVAYALAAAKAIKSLEALNLDPLDKLAVLRAAASMMEHDINSASLKLALQKSLE